MIICASREGFPCPYYHHKQDLSDAITASSTFDSTSAVILTRLPYPHKKGERNTRKKQ